MFEDIGAKIKTFARIYFVIGIIAWVITGFYIISLGRVSILGYSDYIGSMAIIGLVVIAIGTVTTIITAMVLYGLGELIDSNADMRNTLHQLLKSVNDRKSTQQSSAAQPTIEAENDTSHHLIRCEGCHRMIERYPCSHCGFEPQYDSADIPITPQKNEAGTLICPICRREQDAKNGSCVRCGQKFINGQPDVPYWCGKCGQSSPFTHGCPRCGSSLKIMNVHLEP